MRLIGILDKTKLTRSSYKKVAEENYTAGNTRIHMRRSKVRSTVKTFQYRFLQFRRCEQKMVTLVALSSSERMEIYDVNAVAKTTTGPLALQAGRYTSAIGY